MSRVVTNRDGQEITYSQMAINGINEFLDYLTKHKSMEFVSLVSNFFNWRRIKNKIRQNFNGPRQFEFALQGSRVALSFRARSFPAQFLKERKEGIILFREIPSSATVFTPFRHHVQVFIGKFIVIH